MFADPLSALLALGACYAVLRLKHEGLSELALSTAVLGIVSAVTALGLMARAGQYANRRRFSVLADVATLARDLIIGVAVASLLAIVTRGYFTDNYGSRLATGTFLAGFFVFGTVSRIVLRQYQQHLFHSGRGVRRILVVGTGTAAIDLLQFIAKRPWLGIIPAGMIRCNGHNQSAEERLTLEGGLCLGAPVVNFSHSLEGLKSLDALLRTSGASEVVVALDDTEKDRLPQVAELLTLAHVPFKVVPSLFEQTYRTTELLGFAALPVVDIAVDTLDRVAQTFKRVLDICVAVTAILMLLPLHLLIVVAIVAESGLPVLYKSQRIGKHGKAFNMLKFRTMVKDADARFEEVAAQNELAGAEGRMFKMKRDPRVTRVGALLRKFSLDELPQFANVLMNDMSVVGPRPPLPREVENYERQHLYRLRAMPGVTGLWQVSGRNELDFEDMVRLDRYYLDNWSVRLDLQIIFRTILVVLGRKGAY
jgi:exopolysaccharide biosynthesis polyprenyl glycosylphosphotransferase